MKKLLILPKLSILFFLLLSCAKELNDVNEELLQQYNGSTFVSESKAIYVANNFFNKLSTKNSNLVKSVEIIKKNGEALLYIINYNQGFILVSASKSYFPILAYSEKGYFDQNCLSSPVNEWLNESILEISMSNRFSDSIKMPMSNLWHYYDNQVSKSPHTLTKNIDLSQDEKFNNRILELQEKYGEMYSFYDLSSVFNAGAFQDTYEAYRRFCNIADQLGSPLEYTIVGVGGSQVSEEIGPLVNTQWSQRNSFNALCNNFPEPAGCGTIAIAQIMTFHKFPLKYNWANMHNTEANYNSQLLIKDINSKIGSSSTAVEEKNAFSSFGFNALIKDHSDVDVKKELLVYKRPLLMGGI